MRVPVAFDVVGVQIWGILIGAWWCLVVVLICIFPMTYNMEHLFMCLFAVLVYLLLESLGLGLFLNQVEFCKFFVYFR